MVLMAFLGVVGEFFETIAEDVFGLGEKHFRSCLKNRPIVLDFTVDLLSVHD